MTMKKWIQVNELGELYREYVLVHFDVPLLFVCKDNSDNRYLVLCVDEEKGQYLCLKTSNTVLLKMLKKEITMADAFREISDKENFFISYDFLSKEFSGYYISVSDLTPEMLPDEGAYFELRNRKITEYIAKIEDEVKNSAQLERVITVKFDVLPSGAIVLRTPIVWNDSQSLQISMNNKINRTKYRSGVINSYNGSYFWSAPRIDEQPKKIRMLNIGNQFTNFNIKDYIAENGGIERCLAN